MTIQRDLIIEVANDMKWLKRTFEENAHTNSADHQQILEHLTRLNGKSESNATRSKLNRYCFYGVLAVEGIIITILLHIMGVY